jgi:hypothetical protein
MVLLGFEDRDGGQKRVVARDLVGGAALGEEERGERPPNVPDEDAQATAGAESGAQSDVPAEDKQVWMWREDDGTVQNARFPDDHRGHGFPPDGGVGNRVVAGWGYYPTEKDELMFPKGAVVTQVRNINGSWHWGVYAGSVGLFPANYCYELSWI